MSAVTLGAAAARVAANNKPGRRTEQPVRRNSYDVDDRRAQVFRPIGDGTKAGAQRWRAKYLRVAEEYDLQMKKKGERHLLGANALRVLKQMLFLPGIDFKTGRLDPAIETIQRVTGFARATVVSAMKKLREHGFLDWVRRTERTGNESGFGPKVKQATNAYFFNLRRLSRRAAQRLAELLRRDQPVEGSGAPKAAPTPSVSPKDPEMQALLASMEGRLLRDDASSESSQNPQEEI